MLPDLKYALAAICVFVSVTASAANEELLDLGRTLAGEFREGAISQLWERMTPKMRSEAGSEEELAELSRQLANGAGVESTVKSERLDPAGRSTVYQRFAVHENGTAVLTQIGFDARMRVDSFLVRPAPKAAGSRFTNYRTKADLRLPFDGKWLTYWGGRTIDQNYHVVDRALRFATDFVMMSGDGRSFTEDGDRLEDYHCWGRPILAPADATVAAAVDGLPDQPIGRTDKDNPAGNHIVLDLGTGEFLFLGHLRQESLTAKAGDRVKAGAQIGRCGNSGNSSEPHLHVHMQTTADLDDGEGLPAAFTDYIADGTPVERGEPKRGQFVEDAGAE